MGKFVKICAGWKGGERNGEIWGEGELRDLGCVGKIEMNPFFRPVGGGGGGGGGEGLLHCNAPPTSSVFKILSLAGLLGLLGLLGKRLRRITKDFF